MLYITGLLVGVAWLLSRTSVKRMIPFESLSAGIMAGVIMVVLLMAGRLS